MRNNLKKILSKPKVKKESHLITVRLPAEVFTNLEEAAKRNRISRSEAIIRILKDAFEIKE